MGNKRKRSASRKPQIPDEEPLQEEDKSHLPPLVRASDAVPEKKVTYYVLKIVISLMIFKIN